MASIGAELLAVNLLLIAAANLTTAADLVLEQTVPVICSHLVAAVAIVVVRIVDVAAVAKEPDVVSVAAAIVVVETVVKPDSEFQRTSEHHFVVGWWEAIK